jgi:hypothetical protein
LIYCLFHVYSDRSREYGVLDRITVGRGEAAELLGISVTELDDARRRGDLASRKLGKRVLIEVEELVRFARSLPAYEPRH